MMQSRRTRFSITSRRQDAQLSAAARVQPVLRRVALRHMHTSQRRRPKRISLSFVQSSQTKRTRTRRVRARARQWDSRPHQTSNLRVATGRDRTLPAAGNLVLLSRAMAVEEVEVEVKAAAWMAAARVADDPNHHPSVTAGARKALRQPPHEPFRLWPPSRLHG